MKNDEEVLIDLYELTMAQGYFKLGKHKENVVFDMFIRKIPENGKYIVAAGIKDVLRYLEGLTFDDDNIEYLRSLNLFDEDFLNYLSDFTFEGDVWSVREGELVFPNEPILKVKGKRLESQIIETYILNQINFQSLIATKASRIVDMADKKLIADYGLRRAHSESAGVKASKASFIGGVDSTSNVLAGKKYGIPVTGTMAHSWIMSFDIEIKSFKEYAKIYKNNSVLLVDTYNTINGCRNAIKTAHWMAEKDWKLKGIRLDSGDLFKLSKQCRKMLDDEKLNYVKIFASGDLNEYKIRNLEKKGAPIDAYGVGTEMVTAKKEAAMPGVYKLQKDQEKAVMKLSSSKDKKTLPGDKQIFRFKKSNNFVKDIIGLSSENLGGEKLLKNYMQGGEIKKYSYNIKDAKKYCKSRKKLFGNKVKGLKNQEYKVILSTKLQKLLDKLHEDIKRKMY